MDKEIFPEISLLQSQPSLEQINKLLDSYNVEKQDRTNEFLLISALINHTLPESYDLLSKQVQYKVREVLKSVIGVGNLVSRLQIYNERNESESKASVSQLIIVLHKILEEGLVQKIIPDGKSKAELAEIEKLIFKGKCFSVVSESLQKFELNIETELFSTTRGYATFLSHTICEMHKQEYDTRILNRFYHSMVMFHPTVVNEFFEVMFDRDNWTYVQKGYFSMRGYEKRDLLLNFLKFIEKKYLSFNLDRNLVLDLAVITEPLIEENLLDGFFFSKVLNISNLSINSLISLLLPENNLEGIISYLLNLWGDKDIIRTELILKQEIRTHLLIQLILNCTNKKYLHDLLVSRVFLDAISNRLGSFSDNVKSLGVIFADKLCDSVGKDKIFLLDLVKDSFLLNNDNYITKTEIASARGDVWQRLETEQKSAAPESTEISKDTPENIAKSIQEISLRTLGYADSDDSDLSSEEEDDSMVLHKAKVQRPIYIKDLLNYITLDTKSSLAYEKRRSAFIYGPTLLRQKSQFGSEVSFYSNSLCEQAVGLTNTFEDKDFEEMRINFLIAVVVSHPSAAQHLSSLLLIGDYSLQQRLSILTTLSLSARELRGHDDAIVRRSYIEKSFPSYQLPGRVHQRFAESDYFSLYGLQLPYQQVQKELMSSSSEMAKEHLSDGKVLRISESLKKKDTPGPKQPKIKNFHRLIGSLFFFPLVNVWYEAGGIDIGHYSPILISHFIKTLVLFMHAAFPSAHNFNDMIKEFFLIVMPIIETISLEELQVVESVCSGLLLICEGIDESYLILSFSTEFELIQKWLTLSWESIIDEKIKAICTALLLRLHEMSEKFERSLLNQTNSLI